MKVSFRNLVTTQFIFSVVILVALSRDWVVATYLEPGFPKVELRLSANDLNPTLNGLAIASIASTLGVIATRGWARRLVGAIIFLLGLGILVATWNLTQNLDAVVGSELAQAVGRSVSGATTQTSLYAWIVFPVSLVLLACGLLIAIRTFESQLSRRYERANASAKNLTPWQALDQGLDPTLEDPAK